ncbi:MAG: DegT/DnrJ/EryC1/StrS family aminotransferase, partial [Coxiellaceae bacterium]|nr:DegT/DnrJ/EryC1/StrS family aminotransferase [Coxiellaceae bacterium]
AINAIADRHGLPVIEDAAQSLGATYKGRRSCALTTIAATSFFPSKPLGCYGDGGACFTDDDNLAAKMRMIVDHGQSARYQHTMIGINGRLDTIQAAILLQKLPGFQNEIDARQKVADFYSRYLSSDLTLPRIMDDVLSAYAQYTIQVDNRDSLRETLSENGVPTAVHYPKGLHQQPASAVTPSNSFPEAERASERVLSLPFYPSMTEELVQQVAEIVNKAVAGAYV